MGGGGNCGTYGRAVRSSMVCPGSQQPLRALLEGRSWNKASQMLSLGSAPERCECGSQPFGLGRLQGTPDARRYLKELPRGHCAVHGFRPPRL
jgi:hypothetical protein